MFGIFSWTPKDQSMSVWKKNEQETHPLLERPHPCFNKRPYPKKTQACGAFIVVSTFDLTKNEPTEAYAHLLSVLVENLFKPRMTKGSVITSPQNSRHRPSWGDVIRHHGWKIPGNKWRLAYLQPKHCSTPAPWRCQKQQGWVLHGFSLDFGPFWRENIGSGIKSWMVFVESCLSHCFYWIYWSLWLHHLELKKKTGINSWISRQINQRTEAEPPINRWVNDKCISMYIYINIVYTCMYVKRIYTCSYFKTLFISIYLTKKQVHYMYIYIIWISIKICDMHVVNKYLQIH